jgi:hypothetical protein
MWSSVTDSYLGDVERGEEEGVSGQFEDASLAVAIEAAETEPGLL